MRNKEEARQREEEKDRKKDECDCQSAEKEAEEAGKAAERNFICTFLQADEVALERRQQERDRKRAIWTAELDETITRMRADIPSPKLHRDWIMA